MPIPVIPVFILKEIYWRALLQTKCEILSLQLSKAKWTTKAGSLAEGKYFQAMSLDTASKLF